MASFSAYYEEYTSLLSSLNAKLEDAQNQRGESRKATLRRAQMEIEEAEEIIEQLELMGKGKGAQMARVRAAKAEVAKLKSTVTNLELSSGRSDREELLGSARPAHTVYDISDSDALNTPSSQRERLLVSQGRIDSSSARLSNAERLALESEEIGTGVLGDLRRQREQIERTRDELGETDGNIRRAQGTLGRMIRVMYQQKFLLYAIVAVMVALIILILWLKLR